MNYAVNGNNVSISRVHIIVNASYGLLYMGIRLIIARIALPAAFALMGQGQGSK